MFVYPSQRISRAHWLGLKEGKDREMQKRNGNAALVHLTVSVLLPESFSSAIAALHRRHPIFQGFSRVRSTTGFPRGFRWLRCKTVGLLYPHLQVLRCKSVKCMEIWRRAANVLGRCQRKAQKPCDVVCAGQEHECFGFQSLSEHHYKRHSAESANGNSFRHSSAIADCPIRSVCNLRKVLVTSS